MPVHLQDTTWELHGFYTIKMSEIARAAPPILGTNLLAVARVREKEKPLPASSGSALIDESALEGGFNYGEITSLAGTSGTGKTLVGGAASR